MMLEESSLRSFEDANGFVGCQKTLKFTQSASKLTQRLHTYVSHGKQISRFSWSHSSKNNALVLLSKDEVFSSMKSETNNAKLSCSRFVRRDMEMQSTTCQEMDFPSTSSEEACARCHVYQKKDSKRRTREEAVPHLMMGPRLHFLEAIDSLNVHQKELDRKNFSTFDERLQYLKKNENHRVCGGKSGIHGWGLFACRPIQGGEMIIEYRGERIWCCVSDAREARYRADNKDCYNQLFKGIDLKLDDLVHIYVTSNLNSPLSILGKNSIPLVTLDKPCWSGNCCWWKTGYFSELTLLWHDWSLYQLGRKIQQDYLSEEAEELPVEG